MWQNMLFPLKMCPRFRSSKWRIFHRLAQVFCFFFFLTLWEAHQHGSFICSLTPRRKVLLFHAKVTACSFPAPRPDTSRSAENRAAARVADRSDWGSLTSIWAGYNPDKSPDPRPAEHSEGVGGERSGSGSKTGVRSRRHRPGAFMLRGDWVFCHWFELENCLMAWVQSMVL